MDNHISRILEMNSISVEAITRGRDTHIKDIDTIAVVELEMALWAVYNLNACDCHIKTPIESQRLHTQNKPLVSSNCLLLLSSDRI